MPPVPVMQQPLPAIAADIFEIDTKMYTADSKTVLC
jgi:hypothetical protein